jgi:hypothetical protein
MITFKKIFLSCSCIISLHSYAQDNSWKKVTVDENLITHLPGEFQRTDTSFQEPGKPKMAFRILSFTSDTYSLGVTSSPNETGIEADSPESFKRAMAGMIEGINNSVEKKGLLSKISDTTMNGIDGKKAIIYSEDQSIYTINYIFLVNDKMYMVTGSDLTGHGERPEELNVMLKGTRFTVTKVSEKKFDSEASSKAYKIGYFIGQWILPAALILLIIWLVRRKKIIPSSNDYYGSNKKYF